MSDHLRHGRQTLSIHRYRYPVKSESHLIRAAGHLTGAKPISPGASSISLI
jgi:hypothetical protein